jgi:hypothetical protein
MKQLLSSHFSVLSFQFSVFGFELPGKVFLQAISKMVFWKGTASEPALSKVEGCHKAQ